MWIQEKVFVFLYYTNSNVRMLHEPDPRKSFFFCAAVFLKKHIPTATSEKKTHAFIAGQGHLFKTGGFKKIETTKEVWILRQSTHWDNLRIFLIKTPPPLYLFTFRSDDPDNLSVICFFFSETLLAGDIKDKERNSKSKIYREKFLISDLYFWRALESDEQKKRRPNLEKS